MTGRLDGETALVTGGASGLGKAIAARLMAEGAAVVISDIRIDTGTATAAELGCLFVEQDVAEEAQWGAVVGEVERYLGAPTILVNNAGIIGSRMRFSPEDSDFADWQRVFSVNVDSVFLGCRAAIPAMRRVGRGSIINMASVAGLLATPYATAYGATKAAIRQLTKSVAQYCAEQGLAIRCNSVHPGIVRTPLWDEQAAATAKARGVTVETLIAEGAAAVPMGGFTLPEDIAAAVAFLASGDARHITGSKMIVDGGIINCDSFHVAPGSAHRAAPSSKDRP